MGPKQSLDTDPANSAVDLSSTQDVDVLSSGDEQKNCDRFKNQIIYVA